MSNHTRQSIVDALRAEIAAHRPIVGTGAGIGLSAKFAEQAETDLILVYNSGRYRMSGHGSNAGLLAIGDANGIVLEMGEREVLPVVKRTPVIAGINGTDPTRRMSDLIERVTAIGYAGVINFPSHGIIDGRWRQSLEETGFGYDREVAMIAEAHAQDVFTMAYVFNPDESTAMVEAGVDVVVAHAGLTVGGSIGASSDLAITLDETVGMVQAIADAAVAVDQEVIVVCHGGPIATPEDAQYVISRTTAVGFIGASSIERLPVETALRDTVASFKAIEVA
ncbi:MAG: hypothetical protein CL424_18200 [Acidimicrobiaceae bacterium]|nr:hypothetical protein [Acidimicrobiaceae bacterium]